jgi:hypothetical protein
MCYFIIEHPLGTKHENCQSSRHVPFDFTWRDDPQLLSNNQQSGNISAKRVDR